MLLQILFRNLHKVKSMFWNFHDNISFRWGPVARLFDVTRVRRMWKRGMSASLGAAILVV